MARLDPSVSAPDGTDWLTQILPVELLTSIFNRLQPGPEQPVPLYGRRFLSQESLIDGFIPSPSAGDAARDIRNLRLCCKKLAEAGAPLLCTNVILRLSNDDLHRLETLADWSHLAKYVKKFSYLVPPDFRDELERQSLSLGDEQSELDLRPLRAKITERQRLVDSGEDARVIEKAVKSFTSLQHIRIVKVFTESESHIQRRLEDDPELRRDIQLDWKNACFQSSRTVGKALLLAGREDIRFSYPAMSTSHAAYLASNRMQSVSSIAARLISLTLQFDDVGDLDEENSQLSRHFRTIFTSAQYIQAVHVGFLSYRPRTLRLEGVFHNLTLKNLVALGLHGWDLDAEEIRNLALRHREKLTGLRLRKVNLKQGSLWRDVLGPLRDSMTRLEWISLTDIDYVHRWGPRTISNGDWDSDYQSEDDVSQTSADEIESLDLNATARRAARKTARPLCACQINTVEDLGDDGREISKRKAKAWESWVVRHCPKHG